MASQELSDPTARIKYMFDPDVPGSVPGDPAPGGTVPGDTAPRDAVPLERLEAQICELAGHLTAATGRPAGRPGTRWRYRRSVAPNPALGGLWK